MLIIIRVVVGIWLIAQIMIVPLFLSDWKEVIKVDIIVLVGLLVMVSGLYLIGVPL